MIRRFDLVALTLLASTAIPAGQAAAQFSLPPPGVTPSVEERGAPGVWLDDEDDDAPVVRRPSRERYTQAQPPQTMQYGVPPARPGETDPRLMPPTGGPGSQPMSGYGQQLPPPGAAQSEAPRPPGAVGSVPQAPQTVIASLPPEDQPEVGAPKELPPELKRQMVDYQTKEPAGTIIIDTPHTYLYYVLGEGKAIRYGIGVGREGFTWNGTERVSKMAEWPDWHPPAEMIERQPYLPRFMAGGNGNPLGARALYLGKTLYRVHGTNQPSTIGKTVSSGCIRLLNEDIEDLYSRVQVGNRVVVLPGAPPAATAANASVPGNAGPANPMAPPAPTGAPTNLAPQTSSSGITSQPLPPPR